MTRVKCKVSSCHYWAPGDICTADTILVDHDKMRSDTTRMEASALNLNLDERLFDDSKGSRELGDLDNLGDSTTLTDSEKSATTSEATCCRTFRPKGSPKRS